MDEAALRRAIARGHLGGAGLDVLQQEADDGNPFADLPQALVTPHVGGVSRSAGTHIFQMALVNIGRVLSGQAPQSLVPGLDGESNGLQTTDRFDPIRG